jgi:hypothetical protein
MAHLARGWGPNDLKVGTLCAAVRELEVAWRAFDAAQRRDEATGTRRA